MTPRFTICVLVAVAAFCVGRVSEAQQSSNQQAVVVTFQRFVSHTQYNYPHAELIVSNRTSRSAWFFGYSSASPLYSIQHLERGQWTEKKIGWCGVGMERRELSAHASITLQVPVDPTESDKTFRVGISCSPRKKYDEKTDTTYWSGKIVSQ